MKSNKIGIKNFILQMYIRYRDDNISDLSAQLSFFLLLSMFPFLLFLLALLSYTPLSALELTENVKKLMPEEAGTFIAGVISVIQQAKSPILLSVSAIIAIWSASGGISALSRGLNKAYDKEENRSFFRIKFMSVIFTVGIAVLIILTLLFVVFGGVIGSFLSVLFIYSEDFIAIWELLRYTLPFFIMFLMFALIYIFVPCCNIKIKEALPGAAFSTIGWIITSQFLSFYVSNFSNYTGLYGSIGGIFILFVWIYISCIIIILGGEINAVFSYYRNNHRIDRYENQEALPGWLRRRINKK